jgi:hypothetical protein
MKVYSEIMGKICTLESCMVKGEQLNYVQVLSYSELKIRKSEERRSPMLGYYSYFEENPLEP